jgi:hypothetical protein
MLPHVPLSDTCLSSIAAIGASLCTQCAIYVLYFLVVVVSLVVALMRCPFGILHAIMCFGAFLFGDIRREHLVSSTCALHRAGPRGSRVRYMPIRVVIMRIRAVIMCYFFLA